MTRIYKLKGFERFQRKEKIGDSALRGTVAAIEAGLIDADLGGGLIKQRLARPGQGKRSGYRTVMAVRRGDRAIFLFGFAKNQRANIDAAELDEFRRLARGYLSLTAQQIAELIKETELMEVTHDEDNSSEVAG